MPHTAHHYANAKLERLCEIAREARFDAHIDHRTNAVIVYTPVTLDSEYLYDHAVTVRTFRELRHAIGG